MTAAGGDKARQFIPYSSVDSERPEDLWQWLNDTSSTLGIDFVAIPHNSNVSKGEMFNVVDSEGLPITESYARERMRWETVVEITQIKGDSETHPLLSPGDEFADFETYKYLIDGRAETDKTAPVATGAYVRPSLMRGLTLEQQLGVNPFQFGVIGSTDSHSGLSSAEETNFHGKMALDSTPETKDKFEIGKNGGNDWDMSASGLAHRKYP